MLLLLFAIATQSWAERVKNLYSVAVTVNSQSEHELRQGLEQGLRQVLIKVSGSRETLENTVIKKNIAKAKKYVLQYSYESTNPKPVASPGKPNSAVKYKPELHLMVRFQPKAVRELLRRAALPIWSSNRPSVLVWMAVDDTKDRHFVGSNSHPEIATSIGEKAELRGLPTSLPLLDLTDSIELGIDDIWHLDKPSIFQAAKRYPMDSVLAGRVLMTTDGRLLGNWLFIYQGQTLRFDGEGSNIDDYLAHAIDTVTAVLADKYAVRASLGQAGGVLLQLAGVSDFSIYSKALTYLSKLVTVQQVAVVHVKEQIVTYQLMLDGDREQLENMIAFDKRMELVPPATNLQENGANMEDDFDTETLDAETLDTETQFDGMRFTWLH